MTDTNEQLIAIRAQADQLGIKYHHRAGVERIQELINAHIALENQGVDLEPPMELPKEKIIPKDPKLVHEEQRQRNKSMAGALVRVRVQCMNPNKKDWQGEILSVGSAKLGTFKRYVPFNVDWHVPKIIFDMMKEKKCSVFINDTDPRGNKTRKAIQTNEYAIEVLTPLTPKELDDLRIKQAMAKGKAA